MSSQVLNEGIIPHQCGGSLEDQKLVIIPGNQSMDEGGLSIEKCEISDIHRAKKSSPKKMSAFKRFFRWKPEVEPLTPTSDVPSSPIDRGSFKYENDVPAIDHNSSYSNFFGLGDASRNVLGPHGKPDSPKSFDSPKRLIPDNTSSGENADYEVQFAVVAADVTPAEIIFTIKSDVEGYLDNKNIPKQRCVVTDDEDDLKLTDDVPLEIEAASESSTQMPINIVESDEVCLDNLADDDCRENEPDAQVEIRPRTRSISNAVVCVPDNVSDVTSHLSIAETFSYETDAALSDSHPDVISAERIEPGWGEDCNGQGVLSTTLGTSSQTEVTPEEKIATAPSLACETLPSSIALTISQADTRCPVSPPSEEILKKEIKEVVEDKVTSPQAHIDDKCAINREKISPIEVVQGKPKRMDRHAFLSFGNLRFSTAQVPKIIPEEKPPTPICIGRVINGISLAEVEARCKPRFIQPVFTSNEDASFDDDSEGEGGESPRDNCVEQSAAAEHHNDNEDEKDEAQAEEEVDQEVSSARQSEMLLASLKSARFAKRLDYLKVVDRLNQTKATHVVAGESMENAGELPRPHVDDTKIIKDTCDAEVTKTVYKLTTLVVPKVYNKPNSPLCSPGARPVKLVNIIAATATETADTVDSNIIDPAVEDASKTIDLQIPSPENKIEVEVEVQAEVDVYREVQKSSVSNFSIFARLFSPKSSICCTGGMSAGPCYSPFVESAGVDGEKNTVTVTSETAGEDGYKSNSDGEEPSGI